MREANIMKEKRKIVFIENVLNTRGGLYTTAGNWKK